MIKKLDIQDFRGFEDLRLEGLSRLNLIVGRNNTGKTSLLEALAVLCGPREISRLPNMLRRTPGSADSRYFRWLPRDESKGDRATLNAIYSNGFHIQVELTTAYPYGEDELERIQWEKDRWGTTEWDNIGPFYYRVMYSGSKEKPEFNPYWHDMFADSKFQVVPVGERNYVELVRRFARAVRPSEDERLVHDILRTVDSRVSRVRVDPGDAHENIHHIMVDVGLSEMIPLSQAGHGLYRLVTILSDLIGERPKVCFIDEIENGIHHSALGDIWKGLAEVCERLDIQLFATTHSHECIEAAHQAMSARDKYDFSVIQLVRQKDGIQGYVRDRKDIEAALAGEIDLR